MKFIASTLVLIILLVMIKMAMPLVIKSIVTDWFEAKGLTTQIGEIEISLLDAAVSISNLSGKDQEGRGFVLGQMSLSWQWRAILERRIIIDDFEIQSLQLDAVLSENRLTNIAGLNVTRVDNVATQKMAESPTRLWGIRFGNSKALDVNVCIKHVNQSGQLSLDYCFQLERLVWNGTVDYSAFDKKVSDPWAMEGSLELGGLLIHNNLRNRPFLKIETIAVNHIAIESLSTIAINAVRVENLSILQQQPNKFLSKAPVFSFEVLDFRTIQLIALNDLRVGVIELKALSTYLRLTKEGWLDIDAWLKEHDGDMKVSSQQVTTGGFRFLVNEFIATSNKDIIFLDERYQSPFTVALKDVKWVAKKISNHATQQDSSASLVFAMGSHGYVELEVSGALLANQPTITGKGKIVGVDLKMMTPLTRKYLQHTINSGQLDSDVKFNVEKGLVNSVVHFSVNQLVLTTLSAEEAKAFSSGFNFPLNTSLSLLRDRDNSIHLDVPVSGRFDSPTFDFEQAIVAAVSKAVVEAIINYYTPYGLVFAAESLVDLANSLKLEPILFNSASVELTSNHVEQLAVISKLMAQRPSIHITLCGISNQQDKEKLFRKSLKSKFQQAHNEKVLSVTKKQLFLLNKIAKERSVHIKKFLIKKKGVEARRIVECLPRYDPKGVASVNVTI
ncbi:MAG TPA: DUF748 domain-containing protein [Methylococcaceae bacterium]|nr:DUF748 domain-containing protein [Methylococcaceae bacterium]HIB62793.1 DUF748 domain-containing protein [Methylococcaceae bacterium]HIO44824.1 DUF748 domain-containing protein [Methylococcales bacterium]